LCCAPGLKTCAIADICSTLPSTENIEIVGVDISEQRMHLCKKVLQKYHIDCETRGNKRRVAVASNGEEYSFHEKNNITIQLFQSDGTTFGMAKYQERDLKSLVFDSNVTYEFKHFCGKRKRINKSAKAREKKRLETLAKTLFHSSYGDGKGVGTNSNDAKDASHETCISLFDRVLVDAECSTDGALRHLKHKFKHLSRKKFNGGVEENSKLTDSSRLKELVELQQNLISSGFRLLKPGGIMVYSTCSLATEQNEDEVSWLLSKYGDAAEIVPALPSLLDAKKSSNSRTGLYENTQFDEKTNVSHGRIEGTVRFHPSMYDCCYGGGFFLAKLRKVNK